MKFSWKVWPVVCRIAFVDVTWDAENRLVHVPDKDGGYYHHNEQRQARHGPRNPVPALEIILVRLAEPRHEKTNHNHAGQVNGNNGIIYDI